MHTNYKTDGGSKLIITATGTARMIYTCADMNVSFQTFVTGIQCNFLEQDFEAKKEVPLL